MAPATPTAFLHPSNDSVRLDLHLWNSEECPVSYFVVEYRKRQVNWTYLNPKDSFSCIKNFELFSYEKYPTEARLL